jgi:hypothetical protein
MGTPTCKTNGATGGLIGQPELPWLTRPRGPLLSGCQVGNCNQTSITIISLVLKHSDNGWLALLTGRQSFEFHKIESNFHLDPIIGASISSASCGVFPFDEGLLSQP